MSRPARSADPLRRGSSRNLTTFLIGVPLGVTLLMLSGPEGPLYHPALAHYTAHGVEWAEFILFCCALCALVGKFLACLREKAACRRALLGSWDGQPVSVAEAAPLRAKLETQPARWLHSFVGRRLAAVLEFVEMRGSATELDDQLRCLADADAMTLDGSYALLRFINWSIPILGFLGTVLGITQAIANVSPEALERDLSSVTTGLATAFDTTAMALFLTMILMFFTSLVERMEQSTVETVDRLVDAELAHRFVRTEGEGGQFAHALNHNTQSLLGLSHELVEKQVRLWSETIDKADQHWTQGGIEQQTRLAATLQHALEFTLNRHGQRLAEMEQSVMERQQAILDSLTKLAQTLRTTGQDHQLALARLNDSVGLQVEALGNLQVGEEQLVRLQDSLNQNLTTLASSDTFEQAVQSLTAAIHLLTTRVVPAAPTTPRLFPRSEAA